MANEGLDELEALRDLVDGVEPDWDEAAAEWDAYWEQVAEDWER